MPDPKMTPPDRNGTEGVQDAHLWTAKERVFAEVHLVDGQSLKGWLYADLLRVDGSPATIADRLNDPFENYLPLATDGRHFLINKSAVVLVRLSQSQIQTPSSDALRVLPVIIRLTDGSVEEGELRVILPPARSRLLDYLNMITQPFIVLFGDAHVVLIHSNSIAGVTEVSGSR